MRKELRLFGLAALAALVLVTLPASKARAETNMNLYQKPWSVGLQLGFVTIKPDNVVAFTSFAMEIPVEYTFKVGPGELAPHLGFMVTARKRFSTIGIPIGARYKIKVLANHPLYVWPFLDIGPMFGVSKGIDGITWGYLRVGGGLSYLVHPNVELLLQPLGLGATFAADQDAAFVFNFLVGANFRF